jgi:hypothetical protein
MTDVADSSDIRHIMPRMLLAFAGLAVDLMKILQINEATLRKAFANGEWINHPEGNEATATFDGFFQTMVINGQRDINAGIEAMEVLARRELLMHFIQGDLSPEGQRALMEHMLNLGGEPDPNQPEPWVPPTEKTKPSTVSAAGYL